MQKEAQAKEWEENFLASPVIHDKLIDKGFAFLQWGFEDCTA